MSSSSSSPKVKENDKVGVVVGSVLGDRFEVLKETGSGRYGKIFRGRDKELGDDVAIKVATRRRSTGVPPPNSTGGAASKICPNLESEYWALKQMEEYPGFPKVLELDTYGEASYLVMELLERPMAALFKASRFKLSMVDALLLMDQMLTRLKVLHAAGMVHGDVKPENMMMGAVGKTKGTVYLIDYGLATNYGGNGVANLKRRSYGGTPRYMSIRVHEGLPKIPRDDLEGLAYSVAFLLSFSNVPWRTEKEPKKIMEIKKAFTGKELFAGQPKEFVAYYDAVMGLKDDEVFDYDGIQTSFRKYGRALGIQYGHDWPFWSI